MGHTKEHQTAVNFAFLTGSTFAGSDPLSQPPAIRDLSVAMSQIQPEVCHKQSLCFSEVMSCPHAQDIVSWPQCSTIALMEQVTLSGS